MLVIIRREDPNARSSKEVAHLNPATDFYKRLALDCSGAQVAVDLFLLNSQYADLATLSEYILHWKIASVVRENLSLALPMSR